MRCHLYLCITLFVSFSVRLRHVVFVDNYFSLCPVVILAITELVVCIQWLKFSGLADCLFLEFHLGVYVYM